MENRFSPEIPGSTRFFLQLIINIFKSIDEADQADESFSAGVTLSWWIPVTFCPDGVVINEKKKL